MRHHPFLAALGLSLALAGAGASAQPEAPPATEAPAVDSTLLESLVVKAVRPGPAFWKVSDGDSTVWVMGVPASLPRGVRWRHDELKAHLRNANVLIVGTSGYTINILDILKLIFTAKQFKADQPLDKTLSPAQMARFDAARKDLGVSDRVLELRPGFAAMALSGSFQRSLNMQDGQPERAITRDAFLKVGTERVGRSAVVDLIKMFNDMPAKASESCMDDALRQVEAGKARQLEAARGWTTGDLRVAISAERGFEHCIADDPKIKAEVDRNISEVTAAIAEALKKPGKSVAIVDLRPLLSQGGILVRLQAMPGVTLTAPDAPGLEDEIGAEAAEPEKPPEATAPAA
ncbi:MAG: TraB/GumN family protein [Alphaproteobacteria bacterium]